MIENNFNLIAPFYGTLKSVTFGRSLDEASSKYLKSINTGEMLILGGGRGEILSSIDREVRKSFLEKSQKMIGYARSFSDDTDFICDDFLQFETENRYETIVCPFFLDAFDYDHLNVVIRKIHRLLKNDGNLLVADFQNTGKFTHQSMLWLMHAFFRLTTNLQSRRLEDINKMILELGFVLEKEAFLCNSFVFSRIYRKAGNL